MNHDRRSARAERGVVTCTRTMKRYGVGHVLGEKRTREANVIRREQLFVTVVFDFGPEGRHCNAVAGFRGHHATALAQDLADEMNGESYLPPVLRSVA